MICFSLNIHNHQNEDFFIYIDIHDDDDPFSSQEEYEEYRVLKSEMLHFVLNWHEKRDRLRILLGERQYYINDTDYIESIDDYRAILKNGVPDEVIARITGSFSSFEPRDELRKSTDRLHQLGLQGMEGNLMVEAIKKCATYPILAIEGPNAINGWSHLIAFDIESELEEAFVNHLRVCISNAKTPAFSRSSVKKTGT
jgi:hypothetical protein